MKKVISKLILVFTFTMLFVTAMFLTANPCVKF